jgi:hypothetical protein
MNATQTFAPQEFSLRPIDLIEPEADDRDPADDRAADVATIVKTLNTDDLMLIVSDLLSDHDILREMVDAQKAQPYAPDERRRVHASVAQRLAEAVESLIADTIDAQVELHLAGGAQ